MALEHNSSLSFDTLGQAISDIDDEIVTMRARMNAQEAIALANGETIARLIQRVEALEAKGEPAPAKAKDAPITEGVAQILQMDGMDSNVLLSIPGDMWTVINRLRGDTYSFPIRVVIYADDESEAQS